MYYKGTTFLNHAHSSDTIRYTANTRETEKSFIKVYHFIFCFDALSTGQFCIIIFYSIFVFFLNCNTLLIIFIERAHYK